MRNLAPFYCSLGLGSEDYRDRKQNCDDYSIRRLFKRVLYGKVARDNVLCSNRKRYASFKSFDTYCIPIAVQRRQPRPGPKQGQKTKDKDSTKHDQCPQREETIQRQRRLEGESTYNDEGGWDWGKGEKDRKSPWMDVDVGREDPHYNA